MHDSPRQNDIDVVVSTCTAWLRNRARTKSAGAWAKGASGERTRAHAEAAKRRRHVAEEIPTARAAAIIGEWAGDIHPQPMAAGLAQRIDALHGQAGQILHSFTSEAAKPDQSHGKHHQAAARRDHRSHPGGPAARRGPPKENAWPKDPQLRPRIGDRAGTANLMARILPRTILGVKRKTPQGIVVRLQL